MFRPLHRLLSVLPLSAAAAFAVWWSVPSSPVDRTAFETLSRSFANPPFFISGHGTHQDPWGLRVLSSRIRPSLSHAPAIVSIGDDPDQIFQSSPPSPVDIAIILRNIRRLGGENPVFATVLDWEAPDPISLTALEAELDRFPSTLTAAPLTRAATPSLIPPSFRRASLPAGSIRGDLSSLPQVNRIPLPGIILGGENALSGFTRLETEDDGHHLLARWEDRIVFSLPLLAVARHLGISPEEIEVEPGSSIKLGSAGPVILIDAYGRLATDPPALSSPRILTAESLLTATEALPRDLPLILRDDQSAASAATREFSGSLSALIASISSDTSLTPPTRYPRLAENLEIGLLSLSVLLLAIAAARPHFQAQLLFISSAILTLAAQWTAARSGQIWLPGIAILAAVAAASLISWLLSAGKSPSLPQPAAPKAASPLPPPPPEPPPPAEKATPKKTAARKTPAKKTAAKKTAKKAAKKSPAKKRKSP